jgi:hypothetical protein
MSNRSWGPIIDRARVLVDTFIARFNRPPTLRRLHYELVSDVSATAYGYANTIQDYKRLSELTAIARRDGNFPDLDETARTLNVQSFFNTAEDLRRAVRASMKVDRMRGQEYMVAMVVEKAGSVAFLRDWFSEYGVIYTALGGYTSQTLVDRLSARQRRDGRPMIVLYAGDHDPSGEDIDRDFENRLVGDIEVRRVALLPEHVQQYNLPQSPFDKNDSRIDSFVARHGGAWQTELDALDPDDLRALFQDEFDRIWDVDAYQEQKDLEHDILVEVLGDYADAA